MRSKIKVLLVSPYSREHVGGIGTWTKIMLDFCKEREDIELVFQNTAAKLNKRAALKNVLFHIVIGSLDSLSIIFKLIRNMIRHKPDIVHYTSSAAFGLYKDSVVVFIVKKLFRKKIVIHWRFGRIPELCELKNKEWRLLSSVIKKTSASIVIDENSYKTLQNEGMRNVYLTPNPISPQLEALSRQIDDENHNAQRERGIVLFVGHVLKAKGIVELIKATKDNPSVSKLIVIGPFFDEEFKQELNDLSKDTTKDPNWISWEGELVREQVFEYLKKCSVFCLPSYTEGFPNSVIEAMAFGCPIVASKVGAIPEMLADGCGELVEARQVEPLKESLSKVLDNPEQTAEMGKRAHSKVLENYVIEKVYSLYYEIWQNCLTNSRSSN